MPGSVASATSASPLQLQLWPVGPRPVGRVPAHHDRGQPGTSGAVPCPAATTGRSSPGTWRPMQRPTALAGSLAMSWCGPCLVSTSGSYSGVSRRHRSAEPFCRLVVQPGRHPAPCSRDQTADGHQIRSLTRPVRPVLTIRSRPRYVWSSVLSPLQVGHRSSPVTRGLVAMWPQFRADAARYSVW
jgi:hypothetical protein